MRELPEQTIANLTGKEWFEYKISEGVIPANISEKVSDIINDEVAQARSELEDAYDAELSACFTDGYDLGYKEGKESL